jgi:8-oxo-dGTP pyrophosphatase MutT (NUDIX family)
MSGTSGDAWVEGPDGARYWGRFGAAGLLVVSPAFEVLLQHRAAWSHFGGTWGMPGGARHQDEGAVDAAVREAAEEAGVPAALLAVRFTSVLDLGYWSYTTVTCRERPREHRAALGTGRCRRRAAAASAIRRVLARAQDAPLRLGRLASGRSLV